MKTLFNIGFRPDCNIISETLAKLDNTCCGNDYLKEELITLSSIYFLW